MACSLSWRRPRDPSRGFQSRSAPCLPRSCGSVTLAFSCTQGRKSAPRLRSAQSAWPTGLAVKSCLRAPPERSGSSQRSGSSASAACPVKPASAVSAARAPTPSAPRVAAADPSASAAGWPVKGNPQALLRLGGAAATSAVGAHAGTRSGRCGLKFGVKLSSSLPCGAAAATPRPMTTSTTPATLSRSRADALIAPVLLAGLTDVAEFAAAPQPQRGQPGTTSTRTLRQPTTTPLPR